MTKEELKIKLIKEQAKYYRFSDEYQDTNIELYEMYRNIALGIQYSLEILIDNINNS